MNLKKCAEWGGCASGLLGASLLAIHTSYSGWGWILFLLSNFMMIAYGVLTQARGIILMQIGFAATSTIGVFNWLFK